MIGDLLREAAREWDECPASPPPFASTFTPDEQRRREVEMERFLAALEAELRHVPSTREERSTAHARVTAAFVRFATAGASLGERHLRLLLGGGFSSVGTEMGRRARRFDPVVSTDDILQASRNAWTACGLQGLFGKPMALTPSIFAYSMLYPYTDNYLDDPETKREAKAAFSGRFGRRLAGEPVAPENGHEGAIWALIEMVESEYSRADSPCVFQSLLAIHHAQEKSIRLLRRGQPPGSVNVAEVVFEKGGSSVLADGYLAAGVLTDEQAQFVFDWGVLLQLADDLQDVRQDRVDGVRTLFSEAAGREPLDGLTNRTLHFAARTIERMRTLTGLRSLELQEMIARSSWSLLIRSAGAAGELYTPQYVAELERHSPFRFEFLKERNRTLERRRGLLVRLFEAYLEGEEDEPAFPVLPSALMPKY